VAARAFDYAIAVGGGAALRWKLRLHTNVTSADGQFEANFSFILAATGRILEMGSNINGRDFTPPILQFYRPDPLGYE
jgi:hypothetical protein